MRRISLAALLALGLAACEDVGGTDTTRLTILLTDAPGDVTEAVVTISEIYLQGGNDSTSASGRVVLRSEPVTTDLLTLVDDVATLVDSMAVPSGSYSQLRFVIEGAYLTVEGTSGPLVYATAGYAEAPVQVDGTLMCPSCSQTGIKVSVPGGINLDGGAQTLIVDFDVADSFGQEAGQSGKWVMHPTLKAAKPAS
jgi:hypothetical protein